MLKFRTRFPRTWWLHPNSTLDIGFPEVLGLAVITYYVSIRDFMNSWPTNSFTWSYVISIGLGYLDSHVVSIKFTIYITLLSSYYAISNHPVTGSIIVSAFRDLFQPKTLLEVDKYAPDESSKWRRVNTRAFLTFITLSLSIRMQLHMELDWYK